MRQLDQQASQARSDEAEVENRLQEAVSSQRSIETEIEKLRERHNGQTEVFNEVQARFYKVGAEIARLEQSIQHARELKKRQETDLAQALEGLKEIESHIAQDQHQLSGLAAALDELGPDLDQARDAERASLEALHSAEVAMQNWQQSWENFSRDNHDAQNQVQVKKERIEHLDTQLARLVQQRERFTLKSNKSWKPPMVKQRWQSSCAMNIMQRCERLRPRKTCRIWRRAFHSCGTKISS